MDEPVNGLDPEGVTWMRNTIRALAGEGRSVLVSSHLLSEMQLTADRLVVIGKGKMIGEYTMEEFLAGGATVIAECREAVLLGEKLQSASRWNCNSRELFAYCRSSLTKHSYGSSSHRPHWMKTS